MPHIVNSEDVIPAQAVALNYNTEFDGGMLPTGDANPVLAAGFTLKVEPCVVTDVRDHGITKNKGGPGKSYYDSLDITVKSPTFPEGIRITDRRIMPNITQLPRKGSTLTMRIVTIEPDVATVIGRELYAPKQYYPTGKPVNECQTFVEYLDLPMEVHGQTA